MKRPLIAFLFLCFLLQVFVSCEEGTSNDGTFTQNRATFFAGEEYSNKLLIIAGDSIKMLDDWKNHRNSTYSPDEAEEYVVPSYENLTFMVYVVNSKVSFSVDSKDGDRYLAFMDNLSRYIDKESPRRVQEYIYSGIKGGATVTADKTLFGREPGANLGDFFNIELTPDQMIVASYPDFRVLHNYSKQPQPIVFRELFTENTALSSSPYKMFFTDLPKEHYKEITFSIRIPIETEYMKKIIYHEDYPKEWYEKGYLEQNENRVLTGIVKVFFTNNK